MKTQIVVIAKEPKPGKVKTRLCPPCTQDEAAAIARAALADTIDVVSATPAHHRVLLLDGVYPRPDGWRVTPQRGQTLGARLANGFADCAIDGVATLLIGMDTPQVTAPLLQGVLDCLSEVDAVLGSALDGGWWALALRDPARADVLAQVPMSTSRTGTLTREALATQGLTVAECAVLRDVDTVADLAPVAALCPAGRFAAAVTELGRR